MTTSRKRVRSKYKPLQTSQYRSPSLLTQALTHPSLSHNPLENNQRLEFLGDAVLGLIIAKLLYNSFPTFREGELAKMKSYLCSQKILAEKALQIKLQDFVKLGEGEEKSGGRQKPSVLADAFESVLGAYFLDQGFENAQTFIDSLFLEDLPKLIKLEAMDDFKSLLQETSQKYFNLIPKYRIKEKKGPAHAPTFHIECWQDKKKIGSGQGPSKKEAEQAAAKNALQQLKTKGLLKKKR